MDTWGLGYEVLHTLNPRLIYATASALGPVGPDAAMEGADLTGQVMGGLIATTGMDGGPVTPVGAVITDHCGAQNLVTGILAALFHRERTGQGQRVDVSLLGGQIWAQASEYSHLFLCGQVAGRANRSRPRVQRAVYGIFPTADGYIALVSIAPARWPAFCRVIERADLIDDPRFNGLLLQPTHRQALFAIWIRSSRPRRRRSGEPDCGLHSSVLLRCARTPRWPKTRRPLPTAICSMPRIPSGGR